MDKLPALRALNRLIFFLSSYVDDAVPHFLSVIDGIEAAPGKTLSQKLKAIATHRKRVGATEETHRAFRDFMDRAQAVFDVTGPQSLKKEAAQLREFLSGTTEVSAEEYIRSLQIQPVAVAPTRQRGPAQSLDPAKFSDDLVRVIEERSTFDNLVSQLTGARHYSIGQVNEVATIFLGYETSFKTKAKAAEALKARQRDTMIGGAQLKDIEQLPV